MAAPKPDPEREWKKALEAHACAVVADVFAWDHQVRGANPGPLVDGRPSIDIQGPDGEWRRYLVRLTEAPHHAPLDPAHFRALHP